MTKLSKKVLTREAECSIMTKLSRKEGGSRSLKIEQQERSVKPYTAEAVKEKNMETRTIPLNTE